MSASEFYNIFGGIGDAWTKRREENEARQAATALADAYLGTAGQQPQESGMLANLGRMIGISPQPNSGTSQPQSLMSLGQSFMPPQQQQLEGIQAINRVAPQSGGNQPRGIRNNNPGNIEDGNFARSIPGYAGSDGRFARFESPEGGFQAQSRLLDTYANKYGLNTVSGIINRWAPASDGNNVSAYASSVARQMGVDPNQPLDVRNPQVKASLIGAMIQHENGRNPYAPGQIATAIGGGQAQPVQARLPAGPAGGPMAYTASGQPVQTDAAGNAIQTAPAAQAPAAAPASPYGTLDQQPGAPDWKGMAPPAYAPQQAPMPSPVAVRPQAAPMPQQGQPQPYQVAQAGGGMPPGPPQQQQPRFSPEQAQALRGLIANPQTRAFGMQLLQQQIIGKTPQWEKLNDGTLYDKNTGRIMSAGGGSTYRMLTDPAERAKYGIPADDLRPYQLDPGGKLSAVGGASTSVNIDQKGETSFEQEAGKATAKRFNEIIEGGTRANTMLGDIGQMREISQRVGSQGSAADVKAALGPYAEGLGIKIDGLPDIQAFESVIQRLAPQMRVPGSGATSDIEFKGMLAALPRLRNSPDARARIIDTMEANARDSMSRAEIASKVMTKEISRAEGERQLRSLPDPMTGFRQFRKENPQLFTGPPPTESTPVRGQAPTSSGAAGAPVRVQSPDEARRLPKGTPIILPDGRQGIVP